MGIFDRFTEPMPLVSAILSGNINHVRRHIKKGVNLNEKIKGEMAYPLHYASHSYANIVELLIENGADVNVKSDEGKTPLHGAAFVGYEEGVRILLKYGADVNARDENGLTPLGEALSPGIYGLTRLFNSPPTVAEIEERKNKKIIAMILQEHGGIL